MKKTAFFVNCNSHVLDLSVASTLKIGLIEDILAIMVALNIFLNYSPKREKFVAGKTSHKQKN